MGKRILTSVAIFVVASIIPQESTAFAPASNPKQHATNLDAISRREVFAASASAAVLAAVPMDALAAKVSTPTAKPDKKTAKKLYFNGVFRDLKHPDGYRVVAGAFDKASTVVLRDDPNGKVFEMPMLAKKNEETGKIAVFMDLSSYSKEYSKNIVAEVTKDGCLKFPDGNVWVKEKGVVGVYIDGFAPYPKYRRVVLPGDGDNVAVTMVSGKTRFDVTGVIPSKKLLEVEFPGNKNCSGKFNAKDDTITWPDGNVWTKI